MNILIKLTCLVGLVIAPILGEVYGTGSHHSGVAEVASVVETVTEESSKSKEIIVEMKALEGDQVEAYVTIEENIDGETSTITKTFTGSKAEVEAQIKDLK